MGVFMLASASALSSDCLQSDEVYELYCNQIASGMRVKLHALDSLRRNAKEQAVDAITWLEETIKTDQVTLKAVSEKKACRTNNVKSASQQAEEYFSKYSESAEQNK